MGTGFQGTAPVQLTNAWGAGSDYDQSAPPQVLTYTAEFDNKAQAAAWVTGLSLPPTTNVKLVIEITQA